MKDRATGEPLTLLDGINLVIRPHEFVCLLGPSGSGKSTLLSALSGRLTPNDGRVSVNGADLHANFGALKQDIAVVPQKDALHESLAVGQALWYTAKLRLPADTSAAEIEACLGEMLETVGLTESPGHDHPASERRTDKTGQPGQRDSVQAEPAVSRRGHQWT